MLLQQCAVLELQGHLEPARAGLFGAADRGVGEALKFQLVCSACLLCNSRGLYLRCTLEKVIKRTAGAQHEETLIEEPLVVGQFGGASTIPRQLLFPQCLRTCFASVGMSLYVSFLCKLCNSCVFHFSMRLATDGSMWLQHVYVYVQAVGFKGGVQVFLSQPLESGSFRKLRKPSVWVGAPFL